MIAASALVRWLLSSGGIITVFSTAALWAALAPGRRARRTLLGVVLFYSLLAFEPLQAGAARWLSRPFHPLTRADVPASGDVAIVLLGSGSFSFESWSGDRYDMLDFAAAERTLEAFRAFKLLDARWVLSSGGHPDRDDPDQPSGKTMAQTLIALGVPADRVQIEITSRTTREEAVIVNEMLQRLGVEHVVLVTSPLHMRRSLAVFRSVGLRPIPAIARSLEGTAPGIWRRVAPSTQGLDIARDVVHEVLGLVYYRVRGWQA